MGQQRVARGKAIRPVVVLLFAVLLSGCGINTIPTEEEQAKAAWSEVQNQYQRRAELIPNLVETVKGFAQQEREVLTQVTEARAKATQVQVNANQLTDPDAIQRFQQAQAQLSGALGRLLASANAIPSSNPIRTSWRCNRNWKGPKIASPWPGAITSAPFKRTTRKFAPFRAAYGPASTAPNPWRRSPPPKITSGRQA